VIEKKQPKQALLERVVPKKRAEKIGFKFSKVGRSSVRHVVRAQREEVGRDAGRVALGRHGQRCLSSIADAGELEKAIADFASTPSTFSFDKIVNPAISEATDWKYKVIDPHVVVLQAFFVHAHFHWGSR